MHGGKRLHKPGRFVVRLNVNRDVPAGGDRPLPGQQVRGVALQLAADSGSAFSGDPAAFRDVEGAQALELGGNVQHRRISDAAIDQMQMPQLCVDGSQGGQPLITNGVAVPNYQCR